MIRRFRGESLHKVDAKGRVSVPAAFRRVLEEGDPDFSRGIFPKLRNCIWRCERYCLEGYTISSISKVDKLISKLPRFSKDREMLERFINTQSTYMQLDETGRIVLSHRLKEKIGIGDEAIFAGMGEKFQIWEPKNYQNELNALDSSFKNLSEDENPFLKLDQLQD